MCNPLLSGCMLTLTILQQTSLLYLVNYSIMLQNFNMSQGTKIHLLSWKERTKISVNAKFGGEIVYKLGYYDSHVKFFY